MSKFNTQGATTGRFPTNTVNLAGGPAYKVEDPKKELVSIVLSSMLKGDTYYQTDSDRINNVFGIVEELEDKSFVAKTMIYARNEANLRSISHVLANSLVENASGSNYVRLALKMAINRPDDMTEMAALWFSRHPNKMLPNAMRRAFKDMLESKKWGAYQYRKYAGKNNNVKLRDLILLVHPKDTQGIFKSVIEGNVKASASLETKLATGTKASAAFEEMLRENKLGYMAAVKNIRNALETSLSKEGLDMWCDMISDPNKVKKSRMLPFRFVDAWEAVKDLNIDRFKLMQIKDAFNAALTHSAHNLNFMQENERVALVIDESGSMGGMPWKNAITMAAVLYHAFPRGSVLSYKFGSTCTPLDFGTMSPLDIIFNTRHSGYATYFHAPLKRLTDTNTKVDKIIMLTDMQLYSSHDDNFNFNLYFNKYKNNVNHDVKMLFWDLQGYGAGTPLNLKNDILLASGFSDKLLSVIPKMWRDPLALIKEIEAIQL